MKKITVDSETRRKLLFLTTPLEICDDDGQVLARLIPSTPWNDPDNWVELTPEISDEEIERRLKEGGPTYTTQELIERLKAL
jgi:hypothetical protein